MSPNYPFIVAFAAGIALRWLLHDDPTKMGLYIAENSLVVLSPVGFIAANYVLLGRMARWLKCNSYMLIRPERVTLFFVASDVITFFVQVCFGRHWSCYGWLLILILCASLGCRRRHIRRW